MVALTEIRASNARITPQQDTVAVFVGGTSGIGKTTLRALGTHATAGNLRIFVVGRRSAESRTAPLLQELRALSSDDRTVDAVWVEADVSLLSECRRACDAVAAQTDRVDLLFLTTGYAPLGGREETAEGLEVAQVLEYYARILFTRRLMPQLRRAGGGRVVSVLGGGLEAARSINVDDLDLKKPGNFGAIAAQTQYVTMNTVGMERLADDNPDVTFVHAWPGWVSTGNVRRGHDRNSWLGWAVWLFLEPLIKMLSIPEEEVAQRYLFQATSAYYGGRGVPWSGESGVNSHGKEENGLFLVNYKCDCTPNQKNMPELRKKAQEKVWDHTEEVLAPYM